MGVYEVHNQSHKILIPVICKTLGSLVSISESETGTLYVFSPTTKP